MVAFRRIFPVSLPLISPIVNGAFVTTTQRAVLRRQGVQLSAASSSSYVGPVQKSVESALLAAFSPTHLQVINESHGNLQDESHFKVIIVSNDFEGKPLVARHRMVNASLMKDGDSQLPFHALTITAKTPDQWEGDSSVPESPKCMGGH